MTQKEVLVEGYDDEPEDGAGQKLLGVLQKMDIGNILIVVSVCNSGVSGDLKQFDLYKILNSVAKELLNTIKAQVPET